MNQAAVMAAEQRKKRKKPLRQRVVNIAVKSALYLFIVDIAFVFIYPFLFMVFNSFKSPTDLMNTAINWIPSEFYVQNYKLAFTQLNYWRAIANSVIITVGATLGHLVSASIVGYGFARTTAPGKNIWLVVLLLAIVVPSQVISTPLYMMFGGNGFGWTNTFLPIIVPAFFGYGLRGGIFIFIFRQYYQTLPQELENAAYIDGCGTYRTFLKIILPLSRMPILVCSIISMVWHWNDYIEAQLYLENAALQPVTAALTIINEASKTAFQNMDKLINGTAITESVVLAGIVIAQLPIFLIFIFLQKKFITGIEYTGLVE